MINWEDPRKPTMERGEEWMREEELNAPTPIHIRPPRRWTYYAAWTFMLVLLVTFLSGIGLTFLRKGQNIIQKYVEKIEYGIDKPDGK